MGVCFLKHGLDVLLQAQTPLPPPEALTLG